jgi:hypothetical protein
MFLFPLKPFIIRKSCMVVPGKTVQFSSNLKDCSLHIKMNTLLFECAECEEKFVDDADLNEHRVYQHGDKLSHHCTICEVNFVEEAEFNEHKLSQHREQAAAVSLLNNLDLQDTSRHKKSRTRI